MSVYILGDSSTQYIALELKKKFNTKALDMDIFEADFGQIQIQILSENSDYKKINPEYTIIYMTSEKLLECFNHLSVDDRIHFSEMIIEEIKQLWTQIDKEIIQFNFVEIEQRIYGNFSAKVETSFEYQIRKLNVLLSDLAIEYGHYLIDLSSIQNRVGRENLFNISQYYLGKITISTNYIELIANMIVDVIISERKRQVKCVILDLDNTLWGGIIGDDGINNIKIGELGIGKVYSDLQSYFKNLRKRGIILCVCSKNDEINAKEPFLKHPEMILRLEDIAVFVANWKDKASNISYIQSVLNIGFDSMVFVDDNPMERDLVKTLLPEVIVPELPKSPHKFLDFIITQNLFETGAISKFDNNRTKMYQQESLRIESRNRFSDTDDYMKNLSMKCMVQEADDFLIPRVAQLTQRSNQFNLRTQRYTENQIRQMSLSTYKVWTFSLNDRFGDYGIIATIILNISNQVAFIDTFIMSCRVLKRGVESFIMNYLVRYCCKMEIKKITAEYIETEKNGMVRELYDNFGFALVSNSTYELILEDYKEKNNYIEEV